MIPYSVEWWANGGGAVNLDWALAFYGGPVPKFTVPRGGITYNNEKAVMAQEIWQDYDSVSVQFEQSGPRYTYFRQKGVWPGIKTVLTDEQVTAAYCGGRVVLLSRSGMPWTDAERRKVTQRIVEQMSQERQRSAVHINRVRYMAWLGMRCVNAARRERRATDRLIKLLLQFLNSEIGNAFAGSVTPEEMVADVQEWVEALDVP